MQKDIKQKIKKVLEIYEYFVDLRRYHRFANFGYGYQDSEIKLLAMIAKYYHIIEKGLTMPDTRFGFGTVVILNLLEFCEQYIQKNYDKKKFEFIYAIKVLNEYIEFHNKNNFQIEENIKLKINRLSEKTNIIESSKQKNTTSNDFFKHCDSSFEKFALSRHSCRNYSEQNISIEILDKCIAIAESSPSACNRQPNKVYIVEEPNMISRVLLLQSGNRGFGHLSNKLLILTSDIRTFSRSYEKFGPHFNSGMFAMSLIYALHHKKIGSCALNWSTSVKKDSQLRTLLNIPDYEFITLIISCGYPPETFEFANSPKKKPSDITNYINTKDE